MGNKKGRARNTSFFPLFFFHTAGHFTAAARGSSPSNVKRNFCNFVQNIIIFYELVTCEFYGIHYSSFSHARRASAFAEYILHFFGAEN